MPSNLDIAKDALDSVITKSRVHLYKPIQIAEILFSQRTNSDLNIDLMELETYRTRSKKWRDIVCMQFLGRLLRFDSSFDKITTITITITITILIF
jgi:type II restriction enzyme